MTKSFKSGLLTIILTTIGTLGLIYGMSIYAKYDSQKYITELQEAEMIRREEQAKEYAQIIADAYSEASALNYKTIYKDNSVHRDQIFIKDNEYISWKADRKPKLGDKSINDYSNIVSIKGNVSTDILQYSYQFLDLLPEAMINHLKDNGWSIILSEEQLVFDKGFGSVYADGCTDYAAKTITLYANEKAMNIAVIHEIGHVFHDEIIYDILQKNGYGTLNHSEFANIYYHDDQNRDYICGRHSEAVAQCLYEYIFYPVEMEKSVPGLFTIFNGKLGLYDKDGYEIQ